MSRSLRRILSSTQPKTFADSQKDTFLSAQRHLRLPHLAASEATHMTGIHCPSLQRSKDRFKTSKEKKKIVYITLLYGIHVAKMIYIDILFITNYSSYIYPYKQICVLQKCFITLSLFVEATDLAKSLGHGMARLHAASNRMGLHEWLCSLSHK